jgi:uncharacterized protein YlxP (DUF503 family)
MAGGFLAVLTFELHLPESTSLKGKRRHLMHTKAQLERRLGASVAEVDFHELWQRARLTLVVVRRHQRDARAALDQAERYLSAQEYELIGTARWVLSVEDDL